MKLNDRLANGITTVVGSMWAAYAFAGLSLVSLPAVLATGNAVVIVAWITQTFLQLVLLPVILVGQNLQSQAQQKLIQDTHDKVLAELTILKAFAKATHHKVSK